MSSIPNPAPFVSGNFSWPELIQESKKRLICSYYDDLTLYQLLNNVDHRYYDLTTGGFRLGSPPAIPSVLYPHQAGGYPPHALKIEYESEPCHLAGSYPGFFNIPRTGVYEITCHMTVDYIDTQALTDFSIHFVKNGTKNVTSTSGGPTDPGATVFAQQTHKQTHNNYRQVLSLNAVHKFNAGDHFSIFISAYNGFELKGNSTPGGPRSTLVMIKEL